MTEEILNGPKTETTINPPIKSLSDKRLSDILVLELTFPRLVLTKKLIKTHSVFIILQVFIILHSKNLEKVRK